MPQIPAVRIVWLDILRGFSALAVVCIHISSYYSENLLPYGSFGWFCADLYLALCRFAVPVFVMISGFFFLNPAKTVSVRDIYCKYIWRILTVWFFWAALRTLVLSVCLGETPVSGWLGAFLGSLITYWFLPMILALYALVPVLRVLTAARDKQILLYFIGLCFILALCAPALQSVASGGWGRFVTLLNTLLKLSLPVFAAHFLFGYYAGTFAINPRVRAGLYASGVLSVLLMAAGGYMFFTDKTSRWYYYAMHGSAVSPLAFLLGAAVFVLAKQSLGRIRFAPYIVSLAQHLGRYALGIYMLHLILVESAVHFKAFDALVYWPALLLPVLSVLVFCISALSISLLYKSRFLRRYCL